MNTLRAMLLAGLLAVPSVSAYAGAGVTVGIDPWRPEAVAPARPGYVWVPGHQEGGMFVPGYYRPVETRPGYAYEPGYWRGGVYYDGYWRPERNGSAVWVPGHYSPNHRWIEGHWANR